MKLPVFIDFFVLQKKLFLHTLFYVYMCDAHTQQTKFQNVNIERKKNCALLATFEN